MCKALFEKMTPEMRLAWKEIEHYSTYKPDTMLFQEEQRSHGLWCVISGTVRVSMASPDGRRLTVRLTREGDILGLIPALFDTPYDTIGETIGATTLAYITRSDLRRFMTTYPEMHLLVAEEISRYLTMAHHALRTIALPFKTEEKIVRFLLDHDETKCGDVANVNLGMTYTEIANFVGSTRENVTRIISRLKKKKLIHPVGTRKSQFIGIPSIQRLQTFVGIEA